MPRYLPYVTQLLLRLEKLGRIALSRRCWRGLVLGVGASTEHTQPLRWLHSQNCRTVIDIGANRGQFALAARAFIPEAVIFSFEPLATPAEKFRRVFDGVDHVQLFQVAIGPTCGPAEVHVSKSDDSSSLLPIGGLLKETFPDTDEVRLETVSVVRLADLIRPEQIVAPALLKIDVQGYELEALKGCSDFLNRFAYAYVECSFVEFYTGQAFAGEVIAYLWNHGFCLTGIFNLHYGKAGIPLQGDFLFVRSGNGA